MTQRVLFVVTLGGALLGLLAVVAVAAARL
ncbi:Uncharacterised protein [Cellulomonas fimi]|nr:Uncharacterised protein [Cellulomonas fimi]